MVLFHIQRNIVEDLYLWMQITELYDKYGDLILTVNGKVCIQLSIGDPVGGMKPCINMMLI